MSGIVLKIMIMDTHPPVWRRIVVPEKMFFADLHRVIQEIFGWEDMHLDIFESPGNICKMSPHHTCKELIHRLSEQETRDYSKYLQLSYDYEKEDPDILADAINEDGKSQNFCA